MLKVGAALKQSVYKDNIKDALYKKAMDEYNALEPAFRILMGKGLAMEDEANETVGRIAYAGSASTEHRTETEVNEAVGKVYAWLKKPQSTLRSMMALLSGGGLFYVAAVQEKCSRAYITYPPDAPAAITAAEMTGWCRARLCASAAPAATNDLAGL